MQGVTLAVALIRVRPTAVKWRGPESGRHRYSRDRVRGTVELLPKCVDFA
jgi:hypothetical protein